MDAAIPSGLVQATDLQIINYCQLYLHVTTISELFDANGLYMLPHIFQCQQEPWFNPRKYITIQQQLLRQWMKDDGSIANSIYLGQRLKPSVKLRRQRSTYYIRIRSPHPAIHHWYRDSYWKYQLHACNPLIFIRTHPTTVHPPEGIPVTAAVLDDNLLRLSLSYSTVQSLIAQPRIFYDFDHYVTTLPPWEENILSGVTLTRGNRSAPPSAL